MAPLVIMTLWLGIYPAAVTDVIGPSVEALVADHQAGLEIARETALAQN
jgi:NADH-quinone oxidoreductase subunit M